MLRSIATFAFAILASAFATGCIAEANEPADLIWYDDEFDACFSSGKDGKTVEVPCEEAMPGLEEQAGETSGCTGSACCDAKRNDPGYCK